MSTVGEQILINNEFLLINRNVAPSVFNDVIAVKQILLSNKAKSVSDAVKQVGISRSAYYKYKDSVFVYNGNDEKNIVTIYAVLKDTAGAFSQIASLLYKIGANILTLNQSLPIDGTASVNITFRTDSVNIDTEKILHQIKKLPITISAKIV